MKLKDTEMIPNILPVEEERIEELLNKEKAHLIYLMPELINCISTKEHDLREALKATLQEVNEMILGKASKISKLTTK